MWLELEVLGRRVQAQMEPANAEVLRRFRIAKDGMRGSHHQPVMRADREKSNKRFFRLISPEWMSCCDFDLTFLEVASQIPCGYSWLE